VKWSGYLTGRERPLDETLTPEQAKAAFLSSFRAYAGDSALDTGTQDDQVDQAVVDAMKKVVGPVTLQGIADDIYRLTGVRINEEGGK
jgi:hypothetical protein